MRPTAGGVRRAQHGGRRILCYRRCCANCNYQKKPLSNAVSGVVILFVRGGGSALLSMYNRNCTVSGKTGDFSLQRVFPPASSVGIATGYGLDGPGIESWWWARFRAPVQTGPGSHAVFYTMGIGSLSRG